MINQWIGLGISYLFIFLVIGCAQVLLARRVLSPGATRKVVHIGVAHWWIIAMATIQDLAVALIGPLSFIAINWISYKGHIFSAMEHEERKKNLGTVYFPIALAVLVLLTWKGPFPRWYGLVAILVLGWGDGVASLLGESFGSRRQARRFNVPGGRKSVIGTIGIFGASMIVTGTIVFLFGSIDSTTTVVSPAVSPWIQRLVSAVTPSSWVAQPTDSAVLVGLSRLDDIARLAVSQVLSATWRVAPTTVVAVAFVVAAIATAVELVTPWGLDNISIPLVVLLVLPILLALPSIMTVRLAWAVGLNVTVAVGAYLKRSVSAGGAVAGAVVGLFIYLSGGGFYWSILMAFFFSSSVISKIKPRSPQLLQRYEAIHATARRIQAKGSRRDGVQVLANGGLATVMAVAHGITGRPIFMLGFAISIAAANADTWASEIGVMSRRRPVSILSFRPIERGTSGGISPLGLAASVGGAFFIALWFAMGYISTRGWNGGEILPIVAAITGGGFLGSVIDSVLGATVQAQYWDHMKKAYTERRRDAAGTANRLVRGFHLLNNDAVNALSGLVSMTILFTVVT